jgi:FkbM family methyltransferase
VDNVRTIIAPGIVVAAIRRAPIGRDWLFRAYNRSCKLLRPQRLVRTYFGAKMRCDARDLIQCAITQFGVWEPSIAALFERIVRKDDVVVDVGANVGFHSLLASELVGPFGTVIAIEASPSIARLLAAHVALNKANNIKVANVAAAGSSGMVTIYHGPSTNSGTSTTLASRGYVKEAEVAAAPLDEIIADHERGRISLIKIDVEGSEIPILNRLLDTIDLFQDNLNIIVEASAHENPLAWKNIFERFTSIGFCIFEIRNEYHFSAYMDWQKDNLLRNLDHVPLRLVDLLFTKNKLDGEDITSW